MVKENLEKFNITDDEVKDLMCFYYGLLWNSKHGGHLAKRNSFKVLKSLKSERIHYSHIDVDDLFDFVD